MKVKEDLNVIIERFPYWESINKKLLKDVETIGYSDCSYKTFVKAKMSDFKINSKNIDIITSWISSLIDRDYNYVRRKYKLNFFDTWFASYDYNDHTADHDHALTFLSFVYYINTPQGSSPLIFTTSKRKVKAKEGEVIIFPGFLKHYVPNNKCENRTILAGNVELTRD
tara:strand:- start:5 stop:511 length:507 start_codon:yes stop_codon:yes gene_type:complete